MWTSLTMFANLTVCLLGWWKCFANNYLQWAAVFTWFFINIQGNTFAKTFAKNPVSTTTTTLNAFCLRFRVGKLRSRVPGISRMVRFVHSFRHLFHATAAVEMVYTCRLFDRPVAYTHHHVYKVGERKSNFLKLVAVYIIMILWFKPCSIYRTHCVSLAN